MLKFKGIVVHGRQVGRKMGFPTANLEHITIIENTFNFTNVHSNSRTSSILPNGVFAAWIEILNSTENKENQSISPSTNLNPSIYKAMLNIGHRPTFDGEMDSVEIHIFDFNTDIYEKSIVVTCIARLRKEKIFNSI
ncbi:MAG: riboflavin kinase, partial [Bacteroidales bacterium]